MSRSDSVEVVDIPDFTGRYHEEILDDGTRMVMLHLDVFYWGPSVVRELRRMWPVFRAQMKCPLFCMGTVDDLKFEKFVRQFGFEYLSDIPCSDDQVRRLYVSYPSPQNH